MAVNLGGPLRDDLVRAVGRLTRDEQAPKELTDAQKFQVANDPQILSACEKRNLCKEKIKRLGFPTVIAASPDRIKDMGFPGTIIAKGAMWYERWDGQQKEINSLRRDLQDKLLVQSIEKFHKTVDTIEINNQLQGIMPSEVLTPSTIEYELDERKTAATLFYENIDSLNESQVFQLRIKLVHALIGLCNQQESPRRYKALSVGQTKKVRQIKGHQTQRRTSRSHCLVTDIYPEDAILKTQMDVNWDTKTLVDENSEAEFIDIDTLAMSDEATKDPPLFCPFCRWGDKEIGPRKQSHIFPRIDNLRKHVRNQHLQGRAPDEIIPCPYQCCSAFLGGPTHCMSHIAREHIPGF